MAAHHFIFHFWAWNLYPARGFWQAGYWSPRYFRLTTPELNLKPVSEAVRAKKPQSFFALASWNRAPTTQTLGDAVKDTCDLFFLLWNYCSMAGNWGEMDPLSSCPHPLILWHRRLGWRWEQVWLKCYKLRFSRYPWKNAFDLLYALDQFPVTFKWFYFIIFTH